MLRRCCFRCDGLVDTVQSGSHFEDALLEDLQREEQESRGRKQTEVGVCSVLRMWAAAEMKMRAKLMLVWERDWI